MSGKPDYNSLADVADDERLARFIYTPSAMIDDGELSSEAFALVNLKDGRGESYVSVSMIGGRTLTLRDAPHPNRYRAATPYGYAMLLTSHVKRLRIADVHTEVKDHSTAESPYHAGIHYFKGAEMIRGKCTAPSYLATLTALKNASTLVRFPTNEQQA